MNDINALLPDIKLRFNIAHPNLEECYAYGYVCGRAEINEEANPYRLSTTESEQWLEGWWAGFYGEQPIYDISDYLQADETSIVQEAANDKVYQSSKSGFFTKVLEITGVIAVSAIVGYQVIDLVA